MESCSLGWERQLGGTSHLKLDIHSSPIENKYREGKVQSTLERELNVPETTVVQAYGTCAWSSAWVCTCEGARAVGRIRVVLHVFRTWETCLSAVGISQHGFVRGELLHSSLSPDGD